MSESKREFWREHLQRWQESGLRQVVYCQQAGIAAWSFSHWKRRLEKEGAVGTTPAAAFVEARVLPAPEIHLDTGHAGAGRGGIEIKLGARLVRVSRDFDAATLERVVRVLEAID